MKKSRYLLTLSLLFAFHVLEAATPDAFSALPSKIQPFVDQIEISGAVMLVANKDRVLHLSAVGTSDLATGRTMATDDIFWIASMTKPVTAVAIAILVDDGKLAFDDPVEKYLPEFRQQWQTTEKSAERRVLVKQTRPITIRELLTHTSGLGEYPVTEPHWSLSEMTKMIAREPLRFAPGSQWGYSTAGIDALGRIVEVISKQPFDQFLQRRLFGPLRMNETTFWLSPAQEKRFAHNYRPNAQTGKLEEATIDYMYGGRITDRARPPLGGAGLFSKATDMAKFYQMMLSGGALDGKRVLKAETVAEMTRKQTGDLAARPGMPWGLGFCVIEDPQKMEANATLSAGTFGHGGAHGTNSWADPTRGVVYIFMIQRAALRPNPDNSAMRRAYQDAVAAALETR